MARIQSELKAGTVTHCDLKEIKTGGSQSLTASLAYWKPQARERPHHKQQ